MPILTSFFLDLFLLTHLLFLSLWTPAIAEEVSFCNKFTLKPRESKIF